MPSAESLGAVAMLTRMYENVFSYGEGATPDSTAEPMLGVNQVGARDDSAAAAAAVEAWTTALADCSATAVATFEAGSTCTGVAFDESSENAGWFDFTGVAARGSTTTLLGMSVYGQDANYEGDPPETSMQACLDRLP
jgi:hypothetical protein